MPALIHMIIYNVFLTSWTLAYKSNIFYHGHETTAAAAAAAKSLQSCPTLWDPIDGSPPGSPIPGILQARTLEWVAISFSNAWKWKVKVKLISHVRLLATPWTAAYQAPLSLEFSRQEYWSGVPLPSPGRETMLVLKLNPITGFMANYVCLVLLGYLGGFPPSKALIGLLLGNLF